MKKYLVFLALVALVGSVSLRAQRKGPPDFKYTPPGFHTLQIGDAAPDFALPGVDGKTYHLSDFSGARYLMVVFLCNHCPVSRAVATRLIPFADKMKDKGLAVVAINPNNDDGTMIDELGYSNYNEDFAGDKAYAHDSHMGFPYLYDGKTQSTAMAYGCLGTPHVFLFDADRRLRYKGRFDDSGYTQAYTVHHTDGPDAVALLMAGEPIANSITKPIGCSTKWEGLHTFIEKYNQAWLDLPVTEERIDPAGVAALVKNPTNKLRVINLWATWCAPCVEEFPSFVAMSRRLQRRNFEVITISMDNLQREPQVEKFLQKEHSAIPPLDLPSVRQEGRTTNNYLFAGPNPEAMAKALDPAWPGPLPYTIVVAPGGRIVARCSGPIDPEALQRQLTDELGNYHEPPPTS